MFYDEICVYSFNIERKIELARWEKSVAKDWSEWQSFPLLLESRERKDEETGRKWASISTMIINAIITKYLHHFWQDETSPSFPCSDLLQFFGLGFEYELA